LSLQKTLEEIQTKKSTIEVIGLGYVGFPLAIRLGIAGNQVNGIDVDEKRIQRLKNKLLLESELTLNKEFIECMENGNFFPYISSQNVNNAKIGIVCVPTPIPTKEIQSNIYVKAAIENFLKTAKSGDVIIIESSVEVGTTDEMKQLIENSGFKVGIDIGLCCCPERIDPQNQKWNLKNIPRVIYCSDDITFLISQKNL